MSALSRRAVLAASALLLARPPAAATAQADDTARALVGLIAREQAAAFAHRAPYPRLAAACGAHARALRSQLESVGLSPPSAPTGPGDLDRAAARLHSASGRRERAAAAIALERELLAACAAALDRLYDPSSKRTAATIMAGHGQHLVVLHRDPLEALE